MKKGYYLCAKFLHEDRSAFIMVNWPQILMILTILTFATNGERILFINVGSWIREFKDVS